MYNPNVGYRGPDPATRSLTNELTQRFGTPARTYEFVTGYKSPSNVSGHCPDSNGVTHGVDIFLTAPQMRWTADHLAARGKAGDRRVLYTIYADQIASASTGWQFAGSGWGHFDHVHLSVWDGYWGGPCTLPASIHGDTSSWGVAGTSTSSQSSAIEPIQEDTLSAAEVNQIIKAVESERITIVNEVRAHTLHNANRMGDRVGAEAYDTKVFAQKVMNENGDRIIHDQRAQIAGLTEVVKQLALSGGTEVDLDKVFEAAKRGAEQAIAEGVVKVDISIAKPEVTAAEVTQ